MQALCTNRVHNLAREEDARSGAFVARAARFMLHAQVEAGSLCPITMTFAATPLLLQMLPTPFQDWTTPLLSDRYDSHLLPWAKTRFVDWHGNDGKAGRFRCHEQHHPRRAHGRWLLSAGGA